MITSLICFSILSIPTAYELWNDRNGETLTEKEKDVPRRAFLMIVSAGIVMIILWPDPFPWRTEIHLKQMAILFLKGLSLSVAIFFLTFDYLINKILGRKPWYSYLSKSPIDKAWSGWNWKWRMAVRIVIFIGALTWFLWN